MKKRNRNATLLTDEDLLRAARTIAQAGPIVEEFNGKHLARERLRQAFEAGLVEIGERTWSRDDLNTR